MNMDSFAAKTPSEMSQRMKKSENDLKKAEPEMTPVETALKQKNNCVKLKKSKENSTEEQQGSPQNVKIDGPIEKKEVIAPKDSVEKKKGNGNLERAPIPSSGSSSRSSGQVSRKRKRSPIDVYSVKPNAKGEYIFPWKMIEPNSDESSGEESDDGVNEEYAYNYPQY